MLLAGVGIEAAGVGIGLNDGFVMGNPENVM